MSKRAILIGLLLAAAIAATTHVNNYVIRQNDLIGNFMPIAVYGMFVLCLLSLSPLCARFMKSAALKGSEYAVILSIALVSCAVPGSGLIRFLTNVTMLPHKWVKTNMSWQNESALQMVPEYMIAGSPPDFVDEDILDPLDICQAIHTAKEDVGNPEIWYLRSNLSQPGLADIEAAAKAGNESRARATVKKAFNEILGEPDLFRPSSFPSLALTSESKRILMHLGSADPAEEIKGPANPIQGYLTGPKARPEHVKTFNRLLFDLTWSSQLRSFEARRNTEIGTYIQGKQGVKGRVPFGDVPWSAWKRPLAYWIPLYLVISIAAFSLSIIVHTQWSKHELLPYPIVEFTTAMLPDEEGNVPKIFHDKRFWWAFSIVFAIFMMNYMKDIWPDHLFAIKLKLDFNALRNTMKFLDTGFAGWALFTVRIVPLIVGVAYMVRSDVSFSVGIAVPLSFFINGTLAAFGLNMRGKYGGGLYTGSPGQLLIAGGYIAFMAQIIYTGRGYYASVFKKAFGMKAKEDVGNGPMWAARIFMVSAVVIWFYLVMTGLDWILAIAYVGLVFTLFLVMSRVVSETGIFFLMAGWYPGAAILGLMGINAIGPETAVLMFMVTSIMCVRPKEALMPFAVGAIKLLDDKKVKVPTMVPWMFGAIIIAILVAIPVTLAYKHGSGTSNTDGWGQAVSRYSFSKAVSMKKHFRARGTIDDVESTRGLSRLTKLSPEPKAILFFFIGLGAVAFLSIARIRWRWWPLHPVLVLVLFIQPTVALWHSFLIGWLIRKVVVKYGGQRAYRAVMPIMIGMIAGNLVGLLVPNIIGTIYYFATGGEQLPMAGEMF